jgi:hypothetical protein
MRCLWSALNIAAIGLSVWTGYSEMEPEKLRQANPDAIFCTIVFVAMIAFSLGSVWYSISDAKQTTLRRLSWRRFSIDWCTTRYTVFSGLVASQVPWLSGRHFD